MPSASEFLDLPAHCIECDSFIGSLRLWNSPATEFAERLVRIQSRTALATSDIRVSLARAARRIGLTSAAEHM